MGAAKPGAVSKTAPVDCCNIERNTLIADAARHYSDPNSFSPTVNNSTPA